MFPLPLPLSRLASASPLRGVSSLSLSLSLFRSSQPVVVSVEPKAWLCYIGVEVGTGTGLLGDFVQRQVQVEKEGKC